MTASARPCRDPANNPEDWFIESYGKQYRDDELVSTAELADEIVRRQEAAEDLDDVAEPNEIMAELEAAALKAALIRRRHARDECFACPFRMDCYVDASTAEGEDPNRELYGTQGGYYPEQRREIYRALARRRGARAGVA